MEALKVVIEFFINSEMNKIFLFFGMLLLLLALIDLHKWVKMKKSTRILASILGGLFIIGAMFGITNPQTKTLTKAKERIENIQQGKKNEEKEKLEIEKAKIDEEKKRIEAERAKLEQERAELEKDKESVIRREKALAKKESTPPKPKPKPVTDFKPTCLEDNSEYGYQLTFFNKNGNIFEFTGTIDGHDVGGFVTVIGNKISFNNSKNTKGYLTLKEDCSLIIGTLNRRTSYGRWEDVSVKAKKRN